MYDRVVLCRLQMCRLNKQILWVNELNGITSWTDLFLSQFSWAQPRACASPAHRELWGGYSRLRCDSFMISELTAHRELWGGYSRSRCDSFMISESTAHRELWGGYSRSRCDSFMISESTAHRELSLRRRILIHILCWEWRRVTQGRGVDSLSVTVLLKLALCC